MRWSKIKNIIILLLVIVNAALLAQVGFREWRSLRDEREARARMVAVLERNDITFLPDEVPGKLELTGRRVTTRDPGREEAAALIGGVDDGGVVIEGYNVTYTGAGGAFVTFSPSGDLRAEFGPDGRPLNGEDPGTAGAALLEELGVQVRETGRETLSDVCRITYVQLWQGVPVPRMEVALEYRGDSLASLQGRLLWGEEELLAVEDAVTASTALARFLEARVQEGYACSQVDMYAGYTVAGTGATVTLSPAWFIETDASWPRRFSVDGQTGAVTAMS